MDVKPGIANKAKWSLKAGEVARKTCDEHEGIPIALALAFYDPFAEDDEQYELTILMNYDPHHPPDEGAMDRLEKALEYLMYGAAKILDANISHDEMTEDISEYCATGKWKQ